MRVPVRDRASWGCKGIRLCLGHYNADIKRYWPQADKEVMVFAFLLLSTSTGYEHTRSSFTAREAQFARLAGSGQLVTPDTR